MILADPVSDVLLGVVGHVEVGMLERTDLAREPSEASQVVPNAPESGPERFSSDGAWFVCLHRDLHAIWKATRAFEGDESFEVLEGNDLEVFWPVVKEVFLWRERPEVVRIA